jgi:hypothetical protein
MVNSTRKKGLGVCARPPRVRSSTNVFTDNGARRQLLTSVKPKASQVIRDQAQKEMQENYDGVCLPERTQVTHGVRQY